MDALDELAQHQVNGAQKVDLQLIEAVSFATVSIPQALKPNARWILSMATLCIRDMRGPASSGPAMPGTD